MMKLEELLDAVRAERKAALSGGGASSWAYLFKCVWHSDLLIDCIILMSVNSDHPAVIFNTLCTHRLLTFFSVDVCHEETPDVCEMIRSPSFTCSFLSYAATDVVSVMNATVLISPAIAEVPYHFFAPKCLLNVAGPPQDTHCMPALTHYDAARI